MNHDPDQDARLDSAARDRYRAALDGIAPHTLVLLRPHARRAKGPRRARVWGWSLAGTGAAALALAIGWGAGFLPEAERVASDAVVSSPSVPTAGGAAYQETLIAYEEDPELFLWLASAEAAPMAME